MLPTPYPDLCGCYLPTSLDHCSDVTAPTTLVGDALLSNDEEAGSQMSGIPRWLLGGSCTNALKRFICAEGITGCAFGEPLHACRSLCLEAREHCSFALNFMPSEAKDRLDCGQYIDGEWPVCSPGALDSGMSS